MEKNSKIYVAGHRGMVGSAIVRELKRQGYENIITRTHAELDLVNQKAVDDFFAAERPEYVFWQQQRWAELRQTHRIRQISCIRT